jgi:hypothetical protein
MARPSRTDQSWACPVIGAKRKRFARSEPYRFWPTAVTAQSARKPILVRSQGVVAERVELQAASIDPAESEKAYPPCINSQAKKKPIRVPPTLDLTTNINGHDAGLLRHLGAQHARALGERLAA